MLLPPEDTRRIVNLLCKLDLFADQKLALNTGITLLNVPTETRNQVRVQWYERPEVLEAYIDSNPDGHNPEDLDLLRSWRGCQRQRYMVVRCLKSGAILADKKHYQVQGWYDSIEDLLNGASLPTMVETTLLPFGDKLTYDGILLRFNVYFGSGTRKSLNEEYSYARRHGEIYTSLTETPKPAKVVVPAGCEHRPAVQAILQSADKLRGGGTRPLHSPALAMLRWAAQLADSSLEEHPDPHLIRKQLGQIRKAFSQIDRAIYEGNY